MITIPTFKSKDSLFEWLVLNKTSLTAQKKATIKHADAFSADVSFMVVGAGDTGGNIFKAAIASIPKDAASIVVVSVVNTTKLYDSHGDVHFDGLWSKSMKESTGDYLVKEHNFSFDGTITDAVKVTAPVVTWKSLGYEYPGETQALVYTSTIVKDEDPTGMFEKYRTGKVKQHSVGMRYVKLALALPMKKYEEEYKVWKDYFDQIVNGAEADKAGFFWAVTEAKNIEGSAVMRGSNFVTPTISVQETKDIQPGNTTEIAEPVKATLDISKILNNYQPLKYLK